MMNEVKVIFPAYEWVGLCKECGAGVYAPKGRVVEDGGLPLMSACACGAAREVVNRAGAVVLRREGRAHDRDEAKAA